MGAPQAQTLALPLPHLAEQYLLSPEITFLNHGSFGACPRPVFESYQAWQRKLESNPVIFLGREVPDLLAEARARLGNFVGAAGDDLAFVPNATHGVNIVARSLKLSPGDEVLSTDHEYGAINKTWRFNCGARGAHLVHQPISTPVVDAEQVVEQLWAGVTERTRVISLSHITSPTALIFPVAEICRRAREAGILTVIDGAHAPGQIDVDLGAIGADFYSGNCHKWLSSARGAGFLYARRERQDLLDPLVVSHGWQREDSDNSRFLDYFTWIGTVDPASYLSVPAAVAFQEENDWPRVRAACHRLLLETRDRILELSDLEPLSPDALWSQMCAVPIPGRAEDYRHMWEEHRIVVPIFEWQEHTLVRISIQAYNRPADVDRLVAALGAVVAG